MIPILEVILLEFDADVMLHFFHALHAMSFFSCMFHKQAKKIHKHQKKHKQCHVIFSCYNGDFHASHHLVACDFEAWCHDSNTSNALQLKHYTFYLTSTKVC